LLADLIDANTLLISTSIDRVYLNFNNPNQKSLHQITVDQAKVYLNQGHFEPGSMGPKISAAISFLKVKNRQVIITNPINIAKSIENRTIGTRIVNE
jgi:carbamate kinase